MKSLLLVSIVVLIIASSGCVDENYHPDMKLQNYSGVVIAMELNHPKTAAFCQAQGYDKSEQWIIGEEHSGFYGRRVGYNLWGMDGHFNANDRRVHVDCTGTSIEYYNYSIQDAETWLKSVNATKLSNNSLDAFCQQSGTALVYKNSNAVICSRSVDVSKEYTPQEIAKWYIQQEN